MRIYKVVGLPIVAYSCFQHASLDIGVATLLSEQQQKQVTSFVKRSGRAQQSAGSYRQDDKRT